ncbi:spermatogenesis-associated protein 31A6-like [Enhydra lutris kenyoni]|uniref:Spermatogenesis-associated protein 31A6-like n=1 Tax=Enhydra lutris kenyoni TaxID=391180 RepID=A0A2Y9ILL4_ENHLU|nr:spermatogenesis-associated protein 31A6-like [Enhydra lutris kenyoni]
MIPKMENFFSLRSTGTTWLSSSPTSWVIDTIFAFLCGLGLFLLLLPCFQSNPSLPPARKYRSTRKHQVELRKRIRSKKKSGALKACRNCLKELEGARSLISLLQSCLGRLPDKGGFHQLLCQDLPGEVYKAAPARAHQPCREPVDAAAPAMSLLATPVPLTQRPLLLGPKTSSVSVHSHSSLSVSWPPETFLPLLPQPLALSPLPPRPLNSEACPPPVTTSSAPQPSDSILTLPQCDSKTLPLGTITQRSSHTPSSASPIPTTSGLGHSSCPISALSWWHTAAKALCLSTSSNYEYQHEHLSHHSPEALFWANPTDKLRVATPSLLSSDDQKFLEIQVTEGIKINIWKEKEKDGSYPKQMSPDYHLNSLGNMLKSLDVEQKSPQHFWSTKGKPEQLPGPQQLSYPKVLGHHLQQKYNQLFWGLPSLHSESLVATAWISESSSALQSPSFLFNGISSACPVQMQPKLSPMLSQSKPLSQLEFQSQNLISTMPQFQHPPLTQILTQDHLQSSLPILSSSSSPQIRACQISCPIAQDKSQFIIPTEIQHPEWPLLQEQLESGALSSVIKRSQEVFSVFTSNLPEDSWVVSILPENFPISPELRKQLEQHLQKWLVQHRWELPRKIQESLELRQHQGELPGTCQAKGKHGPSRPSAFAGKSSKDTQKVGFQLSQGMGKGLGYILGKVPKDISRASENSLMRFQGVGSEESESDLGLSQSDSGSNLLRSLDKNLENLLTRNLSRKLGQISERMPMSVHQTGLAVNHAFPKFNTDMEIRNLGILKGWRPYVNTSHRVSFLRPDIQEALEAHIIRFWVRHRWSLPLKVLKPINLFKLKKVQPLPILQFASAPAATCVSGAPSMVKFAEFLGKPSQSCLGKKAIIEESVSTLERPFVAPSPMYGEIQRALGRAPSGDNKGPLKAFLIGQEDRPPSQSLTLNFMGNTQQSSSVECIERNSLELSPSSTMARNEPREEIMDWPSQDPCHRVAMLEMSLGSQCFSAEKDREAVELMCLGNNELTKSQTINVHMGNLDSSKKLSRMSVFQDPGETCLNEEISEFKSKMNTKSENQLQNYSTNMLLDADNLASQVPQCHPQRVATGDTVPSQMLYGFIADQRSCLRQQEPMIPKLQDSWKSQSKMTIPTNKREDYRRLNSGNEEQFEELRTSQAECMCHPAPVRGITDSVRSRYIQVPPEKKQGPPESLFRKRVRRFFQWIFPSEKVKGQNALQKCKPIIASAQSQGPVKSRSIMASETPEAQALMTTVGQILEEKMVIHHGCHATKLNEHKQELQAPVCGYVCYHRLPFYPEQRRIMSYTAHGHQATSKDPSSSMRERQARHQQSLKSVRFKDEQLGLKHFPSPPPKKTLSPVSPCQYGPRMPGVPGHHQHCPRHCLLQGGILSSQP